MSEDLGLSAFKVESAELLDELERELLNLESDPSDPEIINTIFRVAHTIKGSSGVVGLDEVVHFTHTFESLMDKMRKGDLGVTDMLVETLLDARDHLAQLISNGIQGIGMDSDMQLVEEHIVRRMNSLMGVEAAAPAPAAAAAVAEALPQITERSVASSNWHISLRFGMDVFRNGMDPLSFIFYLHELGEVVSITTVMDALPSLDRIEPDACYMGFEIDLRSKATKAEIEDVFEFVREDCKIRLIPPRAAIDSYVELIRELPEEGALLGDILVKGGALTPYELLDALKIQIEQGRCGIERSIGEIFVDQRMVDGDVLDAALQRQRETRDQKEKAWTTIPVEVRKLDALINLVGEMVISGAAVMANSARVKDRALESSVTVMAKLIEEIRDKAMGVRMVPMQSTLTRFQRVVRDICRSSHKDIQLVIEGGETELDRNVVERIKEPLVHIIRNAADHGIEMPEERAAAGKPRKGTISITAYQDMGDVVIEIADDGRGLDRKRIMESAVAKGLVSAGEEMSDEAIFELVSMPGFSTAREVTDISGRGVGMDTARKAVEELRGSMSIESSQGQGTLIKLRLPLTLAIIDGLLVSVDDEYYVVPLDMVSECIDFEAGQARKDTRYIGLRGHMLPYVRLRDSFEIGLEGAPELQSIVVVRNAGQSVGLVVDRLHGVAQAVVKSLGKVYEHVDFLLGATILGDGRVAMILDVMQIIREEHERMEALSEGKLSGLQNLPDL